MIPKPGEPAALKQIEDRLAESDPALAVMLAVFDADPSRAGECSRPAPPAPRARARHAAMLVVLALVLAFCLAMVALTA